MIFTILLYLYFGLSFCYYGPNEDGGGIIGGGGIIERGREQREEKQEENFWGSILDHHTATAPEMT